MLLESLLNHSIEALMVGAVGLLAFLVRSFFSRIHTDLRDLRASVDKFSGGLDSLKEDVHRTSTALAVTRQEVSAVWRTLDSAHKRASDMNGD